jgi:hypothetical protein
MPIAVRIASVSSSLYRREINKGIRRAVARRSCRAPMLCRVGLSFMKNVGAH